MSPRYILDTDQISLFQRGHPKVVTRVHTTPPAELAVSIISAGEQLQGRLAVIRRARTQADVARGFARLRETLDFYQTQTVVDYGEDAAKQFDALRAQGVRIGTQDLQIAAIALTTSATVVTRNRRHFEQVPGLAIEDWTT